MGFFKSLATHAATRARHARRTQMTRDFNAAQKATKFSDFKPMTTQQRLLWIKQLSLTTELKNRIVFEVMSASSYEEQTVILKKYAASL